MVGGGGVELHVDVRDPERDDVASATFVFVHGFSMSSRVWKHQFGDERFDDNVRSVMWDLRGHGRSGRPVERGAYRDAKLWADDVDAVIRATCEGHKVVLVGWSYGARVVGDYLRFYGDDLLAGVVFVGARVRDDGPGEMSSLGSGLVHKVGMLSEDRSVADSATRRFVSDCFRGLPDEETFSLVFSEACLVPWWVREAMDGRELDVWRAADCCGVPVLVIHGSHDRMFGVEAAKVTARVFDGELHVYEGSGHVPFLDESFRFDADLMRFASTL